MLFSSHSHSDHLYQGQFSFRSGVVRDSDPHMQIKQQSFHYDIWTRLVSSAAAAWSLMTYDPTAASTSREGLGGSRRHLQQGGRYTGYCLWPMCSCLPYSILSAWTVFPCTLIVIGHSWQALEFIRPTDNTVHYHAHVDYKGKPRVKISSLTMLSTGCTKSVPMPGS